MRGWKLIGNLVIVALAAILVWPPLLAFPAYAMVADTPVYAERPIDPALARIIARADARQPGRRNAPVFLTEGGWRWRLLALTSSDVAALTRPLSRAIIINRADAARDRVTVRPHRTLSGTIAHERTHLVLRDAYGVTTPVRYPAWLTEGYCDVIGGDRAAPGTAPAAYVDGPPRVERALIAARGDRDAIFRAHARW